MRRAAPPPDMCVCPVPSIDEKTWTLTVDPCPSLGIKAEKTFSMSEIRQLPRHEVVSVLQCAGNRQRDFIEPNRPLYVAPGWENGAFGNARWVGVRVLDVSPPFPRARSPTQPCWLRVITVVPPYQVLRASGVDVDALALGRASVGDMKIVNFIAQDVSDFSCFHDCSGPHHLRNRFLSQMHSLSVSLTPSPSHSHVSDMRAVSNTQNRAHSHKRNNQLFLPLSILHTSALAYNARAHSFSLSLSLLRAHTHLHTYTLTHTHTHTHTTLSHPNTQLVGETGRWTKQGFNTQVSYPSRRFLTHGVTSSLPTRSAPATPFPFPCSLQGLQSRTTLKS